jgi:hypothetical protein
MFRLKARNKTNQHEIFYYGVFFVGLNLRVFVLLNRYDRLESICSFYRSRKAKKLDCFYNFLLPVHLHLLTLFDTENCLQLSFFYFKSIFINFHFFPLFRAQ